MMIIYRCPFINGRNSSPGDLSEHPGAWRQDCRRTVTSIIRRVTFTASSYIIYSGLLTSKSFLLGADSFSFIFLGENAYQYWVSLKSQLMQKKVGLFLLLGN